MRRAIPLALLLVGCAGGWGSQLHTGWQTNVKGKPIDAAIARLGVPQSERTIAGHHVYTWTTGGQYNGEGRTCTLDVEVDSLGISRTMRYIGNLSGCGPYVEALR
ncbi:hypothetical protein P3T24_004357 [Paraburkholderia sp. GAS33]